jgi:hypothetical protein
MWTRADHVLFPLLWLFFPPSVRSWILEEPKIIHHHEVGFPEALLLPSPNLVWTLHGAHTS